MNDTYKELVRVHESALRNLGEQGVVSIVVTDKLYDILAEEAYSSAYRVAGIKPWILTFNTIAGQIKIYRESTSTGFKWVGQ